MEKNLKKVQCGICGNVVERERKITYTICSDCKNTHIGRRLGKYLKEKGYSKEMVRALVEGGTKLDILLKERGVI